MILRYCSEIPPQTKSFNYKFQIVFQNVSDYISEEFRLDILFLLYMIRASLPPTSLLQVLSSRKLAQGQDVGLNSLQKILFKFSLPASHHLPVRGR